MDYETVSVDNPQGFEGFVTIQELRNGLGQRGVGPWAKILNEPGIYLLQRDHDNPPLFLAVGTGGHYQGRKPNDSLEELEGSWVPGARLMYVGKGKRLRKRLREYVRFGLGSDTAAHHGGCYVWQLADAADLTVCWKLTLPENPRAVEKRVIKSFKKRHDDKRPFANHQD